MKLLIAFVLFSVAFAADEVQVLRMPAASAPAYETNDVQVNGQRADISLLPLIIPQSVIDGLKTRLANYGDNVLRAGFVDAPIENEDSNYADDGLRINIVDAPIETEDSNYADDGLRINIVDAPIEAERANYADDGLRIHIVDAPINADDGLKIKIVDAPIEIEEANYADDGLRIKVVDAPIEIKNANYAEDGLRIKAVDAQIETEVPNKGDGLGVNIVDAPIEEVSKIVVAENNNEIVKPSVETTKINVVNSPAAIDNADEGLKIRIVDSPLQAEEYSNHVVVIQPAFMIPIPNPITIVNYPTLGKIFADSRLR